MSAEKGDDNVESLFSTLGKYVVIFQWIEGLIDQSLLLAWGHENWANSQARLSNMRNSDKIDALRDVVLNGHEFERARTRPEWMLHFENICERLHHERNTRNSLVHSQYLFEFLEIGHPVMASNRKKVKGEVQFERDDLSIERLNNLLKQLQQLAMDMNFVRVQLVSDYMAPIRSEFGTTNLPE